MRTRAVVLSTIASAATLGIGWMSWAVPHAQAVQAAAAQSNASTTTASTATQSTSSSQSSTSTQATQSSPTATPTPSQSAQTSSGLKDGSYLGQSVMTRYGMVQVTAVISGGQLTDVQSTNVNATGGRLAAVPMLKQEALAAQSANISIISGATYTSDGYIQSLQSALDQAK